MVIVNNYEIYVSKKKIDANSDGGVEWDEFMNYILLENQTLDLMKEEV